jgi:hypothetical protein
MLISFIVVTILQCVHALKHHIPYINVYQLYLNKVGNFLILKNKHFYSQNCFPFFRISDMISQLLRLLLSIQHDPFQFGHTVNVTQ